MIYNQTAIPKTKAELIKVAENDPKFIIESGFTVINKDREPVPFIFNENQNKFYYNRSTRDDILKGSQFGISTMILAIFTVKFLLVPNAWAVSISHEAEATRRLFSKVEYWLKPKNMAPWLRPFLDFEEDTQKNIVNKTNNSRFYIGTAGAVAFGRGDTIHYAHLSELSRWNDSGSIVTGILRAVPMTSKKDTWVVKETTANGQGNYHHREWQREKRGLSDTETQHKFKPHFLSWLDQPEYRMESDKPLGELTDDEQYIVNKHGADDAQIRWRRSMIAQLGSEDGRTPEEIFMQEFPLDDEEAFLFSGNPVFQPDKIKSLKEETRDPEWQGDLIGVPPHQSMQESKYGRLKLYEVPSLEDQYVIFADVGQTSDFCSAHVYNRKTWQLAGHYHARITSNHFGSELNRVGHFFNKAVLAVEVNNMGQSTIDKLIDLEYPNLYMRTRLDKKTKKKTDEPGWRTDAKTKALIIGNAQSLVRSEQADIPDEDTLDEMSTFVRKENGKMEAQEGCYDDRVISVSGALYLLKLYPYVPPVSAKAKVVTKRVKKFKKLRSGRRTLRR